MLTRNRVAAIAPDEDSIEHGAKYFCRIDRRQARHDGAVDDEQGRVCWRYGVRSSGLGPTWANPFNRPDFVVSSPETGQKIVFRRAAFVPSRFAIHVGGAVKGSVRMTSVLRNRYAIELESRPPWTFRMPLFTLRFWGETETSPEFWVMVGPSKMEWSILIKPGVETQPLLATLSFIHHQWWNYS